MRIDKKYNLAKRIWATWTNISGNTADPDTSAKITIYPADSNIANVAQTDMIRFANGVYYYILNANPMIPGQYSVHFNFVDGAVNQTIIQDLDVIDTGEALSNLDQKVSEAGNGSGTFDWVEYFYDTNSGAAEENLLVWLTTDASGLVPYGARKRTSSGGTATWKIYKNVTYYKWTEKSTICVGTIIKA